jgi:hypothetical protein
VVIQRCFILQAQSVARAAKSNKFIKKSGSAQVLNCFTFVQTLTMCMLHRHGFSDGNQLKALKEHIDQPLN